jgi:uncharacterized protein YyaL (SSP411 family)
MLSRLLSLRAWLVTAFLLTSGLLLVRPAAGNMYQEEKKDAARPANRLAKESSPYLLQHAHNPVDWFPWCPEAFAKAKAEGKLVFLSIGYSSCHWCHVMERECFANDDVAKLMNRSFVCIKVDREERPDIDTIYMTALNVQGTRGGWPLSMFLTADGKPIVGGTYWPAEDKVTADGTIRGFKSVLKLMEEFQKEEPAKLAAQATKLADFTRQALAQGQLGKPIGELDRKVVTATSKALKEEFDPKFGGFGSKTRNFAGTKFPMPANFDFLLSELQRASNEELKNVVVHSLDQMMQGGIYDQLEGGFHRYSTERTWTVPHFEKMLYDNGQLLEIYARAFAQTRKPAYKRCAQEIAEFIRKRLTSPEGVFYSALDADTAGVEGSTYVWSDADVDSALKGVPKAELFKTVYGLNSKANFEEKLHILRSEKSLADFAQGNSVPEAQFVAMLSGPKQALLRVRDQRPQPFLDTKVLTCWNGLTIAGLATAGKVLKDPELTARAAAAADLLLTRARTEKGGLNRVYEGAGKAVRIPGYLDDYTHFVHGLLCLHEATGSEKWLTAARTLTDYMLTSFADKEAGGFYYSSDEHEKLFARSKDQFDGAIPSGNSMAARNLVKLGKLTNDVRYTAAANSTFKSAAQTLVSNPAGAVTMAAAFSDLLGAEVVKPEIETVAFANPQDGPTKSDSVVKVASSVKAVANGKQELTITLTVDKGWHLYANPPGQDDFVPSQTVMTVEAKKPIVDLDIKYPDGKDVFDQILGKYKVYEDKVELKATFKRTAGDTSPLEVKLKFQSCSDKTCLLPATKTLSIP